MKYTVEITETLQRQIEVDANSKEEAFNIVKDQYKNEDINLNKDDSQGAFYSIVKNKSINKER